MTVTTTISSKNFETNGAAVVFPFNFKFFKDTDLVVLWIDPEGDVTTLVLGSDYTVQGAGAPAGGSITTTGAALGVGKLTVARRLTPQQLTDLRNQGPYFAEIHEDAFDLMTMLIQQALDGNGRALTFPLTDPDGLSRDLPVVAARASKVQAFDALGQPVTSSLTLEQLEQQPALALESAAAAAQAAVDAESSRAAAELSQIAAAFSELAASQWAENPEDVPVEPGAFSALHWAAKAAASLSAAIPNPSLTDSGTDLNAVLAPGWHPRLLGAAAGSRNPNHPDGQAAGAAGNGVVDYYWLLVAAFGANRIQVAFPYVPGVDTSIAGIKFRLLGGGAWSSWRTIYHGANLPSIKQLPELLWSGSAGSVGNVISLSRPIVPGDLLWLLHADANSLATNALVCTAENMVSGRLWYFTGGANSGLTFNNASQFTVASLTGGYPIGRFYASRAKN